jgi:GxxExxY protein
MVYTSGVETHEIIGAAMAVHRELGCGFTEKVYQDALEIELQRRQIPYKREFPLHATYRGVVLKTAFVPDFICYDQIIVELKAVKEIENTFRAQAMNYAKVAGCKIALLLNFGETSLKYERYNIQQNP